MSAHRTRSLVGSGLLVLASLLPLAAAHAQTAPGTPRPPGSTQGPVSIQQEGSEVNVVADQIQQLGGPGNLLIAIGNVELTRGASRLLADRVELNRDTGDAVAQGKAVFYDGQDRLVGERIDYNTRTGTGVVHNGSVFSAPYYSLTGERMERIGEGIYTVREGTLTTCEGDDPAWMFRFGSGTAELNEWVYGRDASFWVKGIPVFPWLPIFGASIQKERQTGFLFPTVGYTGKRGYFAEVPFFWAIDDSQDLTTTLGAFSKKGVGVTADYRYILSDRNQGRAQGFWLNEFMKDGDNRAWFSGKHTWQVTPRMSVKLDANVTSDDRVFHDYGDALAERGRERAETNLFVSYRWDAWNLVGNALWYQDLTTPRAVELQRLPDIRLRGVRQPVPFFHSLLYELESSFVNFVRDVGPGGLRVDFHPRLSLPIPIAGILTVTPYLGGRLTYYDQRATGEHLTPDGITVEDSVHDDRIRRLVEAGFQAESRASRVYTLDGFAGLAAAQHLIEPSATFNFVRGVDLKAYPHYEPVVSRIGLLRSLDPNIDRLGKVAAVEYALVNRLNVKTTAGPGQEPGRWEMARLTVSQIYDITRELANDDPFKDVRADLLLQPTPWMHVRADAAWNVNGLGLREINTDAGVTFGRWSAAVGTRFNEIITVSAVAAQATAKITDNIDARASTYWDIHRGRAVESRLGLDLRFQCWAIMLEFIQRENHDSEVRFSVSLLGVGQTGSKFGTGF